MSKPLHFVKGFSDSLMPKGHAISCGRDDRGLLALGLLWLSNGSRLPFASLIWYPFSTKSTLVILFSFMACSFVPRGESTEPNRTATAWNILEGPLGLFDPVVWAGVLQGVCFATDALGFWLIIPFGELNFETLSLF